MSAAAPRAEPNDASALARRLEAAMPVVLGLYWVALTTGTHWPNLRLFRDTQTLIPLDKSVHAVGFAGLAVLLIAAGVGRALGRRLPGGDRGDCRLWSGRAAVATVLVTAVFAVADEWTQRFVGRAMHAADLLADGVGVALGLGLTACAAGWWRRNIKHAQGGACEIDPKSTESAENDSFVGHAALVSALTLVSRLTGLVRDAVLLAMFGASQVMSAFFFGFMVPNLFRRLFGEGALTAAFLPRYRRLLDDDPALAQRYARLCGLRVLLILVALVVLGEAVLMGLWWSRDWSEKASLALWLTALMLPYAPLICGVAFWGAVLQTRGRFGPAASAPVLLNVGMIAAAAVAAWASPDEVTRVGVVAVGVLVCGVAQAVWVGAALRRIGQQTTVEDGFESAPGDEYATLPEAEGSQRASLRTLWRATLVAMGPMLVGLGVFQINTLLDGLIAYGLSAPEVSGSSGGVGAAFEFFGRTVAYPVDAGAMATLTAAQRLYQFPLGVFGIAIATAIFPALAAAGRDEDRAAFGAIVRRGVRLTCFIALPATVGLILVREPLTRVMFERGAFGRDDAAGVAHVLLGYAAGVWAYSLTHVLTRAYYARDDAVTPLKVAVGMVGFNLALNLTLIWPLGAAGLAWSTAISATLQSLVLLVLLRKHTEVMTRDGMLGGVGRSLVASAVMAAAVAGVTALTIPTETSWPGALASLGVLVAVGAAVYALMVGVLRSDEPRWLLTR